MRARRKHGAMASAQGHVVRTDLYTCGPEDNATVVHITVASEIKE